MGNRRRLDLLWRRLEDAKQELDRAHQNIADIKTERISGGDGNAHMLALGAHKLAVKNYLKAFGDLKTALPAVSQNGPEPPNRNRDGLDRITNREREVLILIASGKSSKEIAERLGIAFRTVVCHRYRLYQKLTVHISVELTRIAECASHLKVGSIQRRLNAIAEAHKAMALDSATHAPVVRNTLKGIRRMKGTAPVQKAAALTDDIRAMVTVTSLGIIGLRDRALILLGFAGAFRRSELVGLDVENCNFGKDGLTIMLRRSKTDQTGEGQDRHSLRFQS